MSQTPGTAPFHFINAIEIDADAVDAFLDVFEGRSRWMRSAVGYLGGNLYREIPNDARPTDFRLVNVSHWESRAAFEAASSDPGYRAELEKLLGDLGARMTTHGGYYELAVQSTPLPPGTS